MRNECHYSSGVYSCEYVVYILYINLNHVSGAEVQPKLSSQSRGASRTKKSVGLERQDLEKGLCDSTAVLWRIRNFHHPQSTQGASQRRLKVDVGLWVKM